MKTGQGKKGKVDIIKKVKEEESTTTKVKFNMIVQKHDLDNFDMPPSDSDEEQPKKNDQQMIKEKEYKIYY